jgi:hypothetical protein
MASAWLQGKRTKLPAHKNMFSVLNRQVELEEDTATFG